MLSIKRAPGESFRIKTPEGREVNIIIKGFGTKNVSIGIDADRDIIIERDDIKKGERPPK